jgi:hypothetical protein
MKKGHIVTQIFIYMVSAAIFLSILIFGYQAVQGLIENQDTVIVTDFNIDLKNAAERLTLRKGSIDIQSFRLPGMFTELCIYDSDRDAHVGLQSSNPQRPQFDAAWRTGTENVFLVPKQSIPLALDKVGIDNDEGYFCMNIEGQFSLRFEGKGRTVSISPVHTVKG